MGVANYADTGAVTNWIASLQPYIKSWQVFTCPSAIASAAPYVPNNNNRSSYALNAVVEGRSMAVIPESAETIYCQEQTNTLNLARQLPIKESVVSGVTYYQYWFYAGAHSGTHFDGGNLLYCDGHVKWRKFSTIAAKEFGLNATTTLGVPPSPYNETATARF